MASKFNSEFNYRYQVIGDTPWEKIKTLQGFLEGRIRAAALEEVGDLKNQAKVSKLKHLQNGGNGLEHEILELKAEILEAKSHEATAKEAFETNNVFQIYSENNQFEGIVGDKINKGTWELSDDQKSVYIKLDIQKEGQEFTITKLSATELVLDIIDNDQVINFSYVKKM